MLSNRMEELTNAQLPTMYNVVQQQRGRQVGTASATRILEYVLCITWYSDIWGRGFAVLPALDQILYTVEVYRGRKYGYSFAGHRVSAFILRRLMSGIPFGSYEYSSRYHYIRSRPYILYLYVFVTSPIFGSYYRCCGNLNNRQYARST